MQDLGCSPGLATQFRQEKAHLEKPAALGLPRHWHTTRRRLWRSRSQPYGWGNHPEVRWTHPGTGGSCPAVRRSGPGVPASTPL